MKSCWPHLWFKEGYCPVFETANNYNNVIIECVLTTILTEAHFSAYQNKSASEKPERNCQWKLITIHALLRNIRTKFCIFKVILAILGNEGTANAITYSHLP